MRYKSCGVWLSATVIAGILDNGPWLHLVVADIPRPQLYVLDRQHWFRECIDNLSSCDQGVRFYNLQVAFTSVLS